MNLQHERMIALCSALALPAVAEQYDALAQRAADQATPYTDFLEMILRAELEARHVRARSMLAKAACWRRWPAFQRSRRWSSTTSSSPSEPHASSFSSWRRWLSSSVPKT